MNNYYDKKFEELISFGFSKDEAINELYNIYIRSSKKEDNISFFNSLIFTVFEEKMLNSEFLVSALIKYMKSNEPFSKSFISNLFQKNKEVLKKLIRNSKIFLDEKNINYKLIKEFFELDKEDKEFIQICEKLKEKSKKLENNIKNKQNDLNTFGYLDVLCFIGFYMMKYSKENFSSYKLQLNMDVLTAIILQRIKTKDRRKRSIDEHHIEKSFDRRFSIELVDEDYKSFEEIVKTYEEYEEFKGNILDVFCYSNNYDFTLSSDELTIIIKDVNRYKKWHKDGEKLTLLFKYYNNIASEFTKQRYSKEHFFMQNEITRKVFVTTLETQLLLKNIYGLKEEFYLDEKHKVPLSKCIHALNELKGFYQKFFLNLYLDNLSHSNDWFKAWMDSFNMGLSQGLNRFPLNYQKVGEFASNMKEEVNPLDYEDRLSIEKFWSVDLKEVLDNKKAKINNIFEKPFMKIDDYVFMMPYFLGHQKSSLTFINSLFKVHQKRQSFRKDEVYQSTKNLEKLFLDNGFNVQIEYKLPNFNGDVDLLCEKDGYLIVLELKSTYIRQSFENIWNYKTGALAKAGNQLLKRKVYLESLIAKREAQFTSNFGIPKKVYYYIVDTSFEFDHEKFSGFLKISMFELMYLLNKQNRIFAQGFDVRRFVAIIENNILYDDICDVTIPKDLIAQKVSL